VKQGSTTARSGPFQILFAAMLWGTTGTSQALAPAGTTPLGVASVRVCLGGIALFLIGWSRGLLRGRRMSGRHILAAAGSLVAAQLSFFAAVDRTGVAVGTVVAVGSSPIAAGVLAWLIRRERPGRRWAIATAVGVTGAVLLLAAGRAVNIDATGVGLALIVGLGYAGYIVSTKDLVDEHPPDAVTAAVFGVAAVAMLPLLFVADLGWAAEPRGLAITLHLGLVTVAFAYSIFSRGLIMVPAAIAVTLTLAEPLTAGVLGVVVLDERLSLFAGAGIVLVLASLVLLTVPARPPAAQA
jgi:drug/metabolite transporter, DME family